MLVPSIFDDHTVENVFSNIVQDMGFGSRRFGNPFTSMNMDVKEYENAYEMDMELPGFEKEEINAQLKDGYLMIQAMHNEHADQKDNNGKYIRRERRYGSCQRSIYVGKDVTQDEIEAKFENGILKLIIPKKESQPSVEENQFIKIEG